MDGLALLQGDAAHHLGRVLRAETGQMFELSDGNSVWLARADKIGRDTVEFALVQELPAEASPVKVTLLLAIVKFDRFEWALEKATELGVDAVIPLAARRSEKNLIASSQKRADRWRKILVESAQQSRRLRVPVLHPTQATEAALASADGGLRLLLSERLDARSMRELMEPYAERLTLGSPLKVTLGIGPEGGWTDEEFAAAIAAGFAEAALGRNILRTETAVCAALSAVQYALGGMPVAADAGAVSPQSSSESEHERI